MNALDHYRHGARILRKVFDVFVIWPSVFIGLLIFGIGLQDGNPSREIVSSAYEWGRATFSTAPPGKVLVFRETASTASDMVVLPKVVDISERELVPMSLEEAIDETANALTNIYWSIVVICIALMALTTAIRSFLPMPSKNENGNSP